MSSQPSSDRGAAMVELALSVVIVLLLIFGLIDLGRYVAVASTVTNASREGARYATAVGVGDNGVPRYQDCIGINDAAQQFGVVAKPENADITITYIRTAGNQPQCNGDVYTSGDLDTGDQIKVDVSVSWSPFTPFVGAFVGPTTISASTTRTFNLGT